MADVPASTASTAELTGVSAFGTILVGAYAGVLESFGDHDWIRFSVTAGTRYQVSADMWFGNYNQSAGIVVRDASGNAVADLGSIGNPDEFTATSTGTYFLDISAIVAVFRLGGYRYDVLVNTARTVQSLPADGSGPSFAGQSNTLVEGSGFDDQISVGANGIAFGSGGDDYIVMNSSGGAAHGGVGDDGIVGSGGLDLLWGGHDNDILQGRGGADILYGDQGQDVLFGGEGADTITGGDHEDYLAGETGDDILDGGAGADYLTGGQGDDTYDVDDGTANGDLVVEAEGEGLDTVRASVTYTLTGNVETLVLVGSGAVGGTGNALANTITGNGAANTLDGGGGADILSGGLGNDTYVVNGADTVMEAAGAGRDTVRSSVSYTLAAEVETLVLTGTGSLSGNGNTLANTMIGNTGANQLNGRLGNDILTGGAGKDTFLFNTAPSSANLDRITDFVAFDDTIRLENAVFTGLTRTGTLASSAFKDITDGTKLDADDRILYNHDTGRVFYDADGSGSQTMVVVVILDTRPTLTFQDFQVV